MKCLFGVQKYNNNFQMSLQFVNLKEDNEMKQFFEFIQNTEFECMKYLDLDENDSDRFVSQIKYDKQKKYDPNLSVKIPFHYNQFQTDIYDATWSKYCMIGHDASLINQQTKIASQFLYIPFKYFFCDGLPNGSCTSKDKKF